MSEQPAALAGAMETLISDARAALAELRAVATKRFLRLSVAKVKDAEERAPEAAGVWL